MTTTTDARSPRWTFRHTLLLIGAVCCVFLLSEFVGPEREYKRDRFHDTLTLSDGQRVKVDIEVVWREGDGCSLTVPCRWEPYFSVVEVKRLDGVRLAPVWVSKRGLLPMLVDVPPGATEMLVVAAPKNCSHWAEIGRPVLPYAAFSVEDGRWVRTPLPASMHGLPSNIAIVGERRWMFSLRRLVLMRFPIQSDYVYSLTRVHPSVGTREESFEEWNFNWRVQGRSKVCDRLTAFGF